MVWLFLMDIKQEHKLSREFQRLEDLCQGETVTFRRLLEGVTTREHALLSLFLIIPFLFFIPLPGISTLFGGVIMLAGYRMALGKKLWIPKRWLDRPLPSARMKKIFSVGQVIMRKIEKVVQPRGKFFLTHPWVERFNGVLLVICGLFLALLLPPGFNFPPAFAILFMSIGILEDDGIFLTIGYLLVGLNLLLFNYLFFFGFNSLKAFFG